jgi:hypothetical protein
MKTSAHYLLFALAVFVGSIFACAQAPDPAKEKHVTELGAAQMPSIQSSSLCQQALAAGRTKRITREVDPKTLETDLGVLMRDSDEVVLVGSTLRQASLISPSGQEVYTVKDVKVLRTWKGSRKVGEVLTFAVPYGSVPCDDAGHLRVTTEGTPLPWTPQRPVGKNGFVFDLGPFVLFLRQSRDDEALSLPGLRLTGNDGLQGLFQLLHSDVNECLFASLDASVPCNALVGAKFRDIRDCPQTKFDSIAACYAILQNELVSVMWAQDPFSKKYHGMPVPAFLQEVQSLAEKLGYVGHSASTK